MNDMVAPAGAKLLAIIERVEAIREEIKERQNDVRDVYAEAKASGLDVNTVKAVIQRRSKDQLLLQESNQLLEAYLAAIDQECTKRVTRGPRQSVQHSQTFAPT